MTDLVEKIWAISQVEKALLLPIRTKFGFSKRWGCGGDKKQKVVWVAVRIPDGMISGHANQARIGQFSTYNTDVITSKNCIKSLARRGWF